MAIESSGAYEEAQALARELGPTIDGARYLKLVEAAPANDMGTPDREAQAFRRAHAIAESTLDDELAWLPTGGEIAWGDLGIMLLWGLGAGWIAARRFQWLPKT